MLKLIALILALLIIFGGLMLWIPVNIWTIGALIALLIVIIFF